MTISRADLLKEILPGLNELFGLEYSKYSDELFGMQNDIEKYEIEVDLDE